VRNFQISIVSAVKIRKQCLQTASASEDFVSRPSRRARPWTPGRLPSPDPLAIAPNENFLHRQWYQHTKRTFLGHCFHKLEREQERQTDTHDRTHYQAAFVGDNSVKDRDSPWLHTNVETSQLIPVS